MTVVIVPLLDALMMTTFVSGTMFLTSAGWLEYLPWQRSIYGVH